LKLMPNAAAICKAELPPARGRELKLEEARRKLDVVDGCPPHGGVN